MIPTVQMSAGTRMMMESEQNQAYPTVKSNQRTGISPENRFKESGRCSRQRSREELSRSRGRRSCPDRGHGGFVVGGFVVERSGKSRGRRSCPDLLVGGFVVKSVGDGIEGVDRWERAGGLKGGDGIIAGERAGRS
ncbi:uncharacterized protein A4U43_C07F12680 [Asparagus officinalis]|uniref:Uncharacterized protein n=1 Tax=Asparagus officinalis TaxID=4686 RepID=A0A5P1EBG4_ASPOF|nr:uncharacterized protein A4U43_C07F12680 [Asparagus officinalis]